MKITIFLILCSLLASCGTNKVNLRYEPMISSREKNNITLALDSLEDERKNKTRIGAIRNVSWIPIVTIEAKQNVPTWVQHALKKELKHAGYTISNIENADYEIEGKVLYAHADSYYGYHGNMQVELTLKKEGEALFTKAYASKENIWVSVHSSGTGCAEVLEQSLQEISRQFIEDLDYILEPTKPFEKALPIQDQNQQT